MEVVRVHNDTLRTGPPAPSYPGPSHCWLCGRFGSGSRCYAQRSCSHCGVKWHALLPGASPALEINRDYELSKIRRNYMPRGMAGDGLDIFDDFIDHAEVKLATPA